MVIVVAFGMLCSTIDVRTQPKTLTILHTNDMHASFLPHEAGWVQSSPKPMVGGFRELWWMVDSIRRSKGDVLVLDGGDVMTGTPISEFDYKGGTGGALFELMNMVGYDAWTIGNHDLDISQDNLRTLTAIARFPTVSANLVDTTGRLTLNNKDYVIVKKNGLRIGIIGLMAPDLFHLTNTNNLKGLKVLSPVEVVQKIIDKINRETDLIVALTHEGVDADSILAVSAHGLSIIIGGHSHTRLKTPKMINGVIVCQAGSNCENLGELELTIDGGKVTASNGKLLTLWARSDRPENEISKFIAEYKKNVDKDYGIILGTLSADWKRSRSGESNVGSFVADAIREGAKASVGITNSSGIRKDLSAGNITKLDLFEISPFRNYLCTFSLSGGELRGLVQRYLQSMIEGKTSLDLSGITATWKRESGRAKIMNLKIDGQDIVDDRAYLIATSDFLINQSDKYLGMTPKKVNYTQTTISQMLVAKVQKEKTISGGIEMHFIELQ